MYKILPYYSFGNNEKVEFKGRVIIDNGFEQYQDKVGTFGRIMGFWKRFSVKPALGVAVTINFENKSKIVTTNEYGIFSATFDPADSTDDKWLVAQAVINLNSIDIIANLNSINDVSDNDYGIISDIDDTILISHATQKLRLIYLTIFKKPADRKAFDGISDLYNDLVKGPTGLSTNPIFYVSSSHWNLFDLLTKFTEQNKFPKGPLLLKRVRNIKETILTIGNHEHKKEKIIELLTFYPDLEFILIGDSGQRDAAIYTQIAREYPERIMAILIRDVTPYIDPVVEASKKLTPESIPFITFTDSVQATDIARELKLIK